MAATGPGATCMPRPWSWRSASKKRPRSATCAARAWAFSSRGWPPCGAAACSCCRPRAGMPISSPSSNPRPIPSSSWTMPGCCSRIGPSMRAAWSIRRKRNPLRRSDASLAWNPDLDAPLLRLYTSGSTGAPQPQIKTLGQFARGAQVLAARLDQEVEGGLAAAAQHRLQRAAAAHVRGRNFGHAAAGDGHPGARPQAAAARGCACRLRAVRGRRGLDRDAAAPARARPVRRGAAALPPRAGVHHAACSGAGRAGRDAGRARRWSRSTDPRKPAWSPCGAARSIRAGARCSGVRIESEGECTRAWGTHFPSPQTLADQVELDARGGFTLLGRRGDLIKIAGRRASLAGLNLLLQDLPGLTDGVFYLPATGAPDRTPGPHPRRSRWTVPRPRRGCASAWTRCSCRGPSFASNACRAPRAANCRARRWTQLYADRLRKGSSR